MRLQIAETPDLRATLVGRNATVPPQCWQRLDWVRAVYRTAMLNVGAKLPMAPQPIEAALAREILMIQTSFSSASGVSE